MGALACGVSTMTYSKRFPDTGKSWRRWLENFIAWPVEGMHWAWLKEAQAFVSTHGGGRMCDRMELTGHSRGGAVALYVTALMCDSGIPITVRVTGVPRCWFGRKGRELMRALQSQHIVISYKARGDFITWLPPWFCKQPSTVIGPERMPSWEAHKPSYYRIYGG